MDSEGAYIGPNATQVSLDAVEANVMSLHNVPGYRLSADCNPTTLTKDSVRISYTEGGYVTIYLDSNITPAAASELGVPNITIPASMYYEWAGNPKDYFYDWTMSFEFLAFGVSHFFVNLIQLNGFEQIESDTYNRLTSVRTFPTPWGDLSSVYQNITVPLSGATGAYGTVSRALQCVLLRQEGLLEYRRRDDQSWFIASSSFQEKRKLVRSFLQDWQNDLSDPSDRLFPVLADVLWGGAGTVKVCREESDVDHCYPYKDFTTAVNNFVFASGETTRILYNVAAADASHDNADYFYNVTGEVDRQLYCITYVPVLLLVALLGIIISALLVTVLVVATMDTWSWKTFRQVEITRLVVDCVGADLAKGDSTFSRLRRASDDELAEWAGRYRVGYEKIFDAQNMDGDGHPSVRLRHTTGGDIEKYDSYETVRSMEQSG